MKYTVGQKLKVEMRDGFHLSEIVQREVTISKICGNLIWIKYKLEYDGYKQLFGTEKDLDKLVIKE